jgi:APA family basic amino acid/polyamine antiporter
MNIFRRKTVAALQAEAESDHRLSRTLGPTNLIALGIGAIIGGGIFVLSGKVAAQNAGPAVVLSFVLAGFASVFAALCYSEFASLVPMSGSAYTYGYATLGELVAWIIGWDLVLEYAVGAITVAISWSGYVVSLLNTIGLHLPPAVAAAPGTHLVQIPAAVNAALGIPTGWQVATEALLQRLTAGGVDPASLAHGTAVLNLPAVLIVAVISTLLIIGVRESARFNNAIVLLKLAVITIFIIAVVKAVNPANWHPFIPANTGVREHFGWTGLMTGAGIVFFAYIGFDAVSTAAQEARNPSRDMPLGIIGSLLICTVLYILVSGVMTGVVNYRQLAVPDPIALVADYAGLTWLGGLIKIGAIIGLSSVILVLLYGQSRVFWAMAKDGLLPPIVQHVHPRFRTPWITTIFTGLCVAVFAGTLRIDIASELCSIGTLLAFVIVSVGVLFLRVRHPELRARFRTPMVWFVAPMGALSALYLMVSLPWPTWERLLIWFAIGLVIYFGHGIYNSKLSPGPLTGETYWSRAVKMIGLAWMIVGSLLAVIWTGRHFNAQLNLFGVELPAWAAGAAAIMVFLSAGALLNLLAQITDHVRARHERDEA